jgi:hypothetical protein
VVGDAAAVLIEGNRQGSAAARAGPAAGRNPAHPSREEASRAFTPPRRQDENAGSLHFLRVMPMTSIRRLSFVAASALLGLVLSAQAVAQADPSGYEQRKANVLKGAPGAALAAASPAGPAATVRGALHARGASEATAASLRETSSNTTRAGITHLRMEQQVAGLTVYGRYVKAAVNARGELVNLIENVAAVPSTPPAEPRINAQRALQAAMARVHPGMQPAFEPSGAAGNTTTFAGGSFFSSDPSVTRVAVPMSDGTLAVGYLVETWTARDNQLNHTLVSGDGRVLHVESRTARDSYNVFTIDPSKTPQAIVAGPGAATRSRRPAGSAPARRARGPSPATTSSRTSTPTPTTARMAAARRSSTATS